MFKVSVHVLLKDDVLDPQGKTVMAAVESLGFNGISDLRIGKVLQFCMDSANEQDTRSRVEELCRTVFINPVIEKFEYTLEVVSS